MEPDMLADVQRIVRDPAVMVGKPVVRGTRRPAAVVLEYLSENPDMEELLEAYPRLTIEDVKACLAYARVHAKRVGRSRKATVRTVKPAV